MIEYATGGDGEFEYGWDELHSGTWEELSTKKLSALAPRQGRILTDSEPHHLAGFPPPLFKKFWPLTP